MGKAEGWGKRFDLPIVLPDGKKLATLRDAIHHLAKTVPKCERYHPAVVLAVTVVSNAAGDKDFVTHARIAVMKALNRHEDRQ